jgi:hypothetical protein
MATWAKSEATTQPAVAIFGDFLHYDLRDAKSADLDRVSDAHSLHNETIPTDRSARLGVHLPTVPGAKFIFDSVQVWHENCFN